METYENELSESDKEEAITQISEEIAKQKSLSDS